MATFHYDNNSKSSGIYIIFNNLNWRIYVGSCKCFKQRWYEHNRALEREKHSNRFLQADWNKCGSNAFEFYVLENMPGALRENRLLAEEAWIAKHYDNGKLCYNLQKNAVSREGFKDAGQRKTRKDKGQKRKPLSEETKRKLREINLGKKQTAETRLKQSLVKLGKKMSVESKMKLSNTRKGKPFHQNSSRLGKKHTAESKMKMSLAHKNITEETRKKMSLSHLGKTYRERTGRSQ